MTSSTISDLFPAPDPEIFPDLTGRQAPHHLSVSEGNDNHGIKAITLAWRVTQPMMPWQQGNLRAMLRTNADGRWTHPDCVLICPRQNGKSEILLMRCLYGLFKLGEKILYTVQRWDTGKELHTRLVTTINAIPSLKKRLKAKPTLSQGRGTILLDNGAQLITSTRSADMGRGITKLDLLIYDEAYNLDEAAEAAVGWAQMAADDPQTIYTSSAVNADQHSKGLVLAGLRRAGLDCVEGIFFAEYMAPEDMPHDAVATWEYANPSYGVIATAEKMRGKLRKVTTAAGRIAFGVEALGRGLWPVDEAAQPAFIDRELWMGLATGAVTLVGSPALAVDMTPDRKFLSIALAMWTEDGRVHAEVGYHGPAGPRVTQYLTKLVARLDPCAVVIDGASPAAPLVLNLRNAGIEATVTNATQMAQASGGFVDDINARQIHHTGDPLLDDAREGTRKRDMPGGGIAFNRKGANVISPFVASALAHWGLLGHGTQVQPVQSLAVETPQQRARNRPASQDGAADLARGGTADLAHAGF